MFEMKFKVIEIRDGGVTIKHYLKGRKKDVKEDIENFKQNSKKYEVFGKEGMVIWVWYSYSLFFFAKITRDVMKEEELAQW